MSSFSSSILFRILLKSNIAKYINTDLTRIIRINIPIKAMVMDCTRYAALDKFSLAVIDRLMS